MKTDGIARGDTRANWLLYPSEKYRRFFGVVASGIDSPLNPFHDQKNDCMRPILAVLAALARNETIP